MPPREKGGLQIFRNVNFGSGEVTISSALKALDNYFVPKRNVVYQSVSNSCCQAPDETVVCFVNRLRKLASSCQYGALTRGSEEMLGDGLVIGIQDKNTKAKLLRERALSLDKALDTFKSSEVTNQQLKSIQNDEKKDNDKLNFVRDNRRSAQGKKPPNQKKPPSQKQPANKSWKCNYCGQQEKHAKPTDCPEHGQK